MTCPHCWLLCSFFFVNTKLYKFSRLRRGSPIIIFVVFWAVVGFIEHTYHFNICVLLDYMNLTMCNIIDRIILIADENLLIGRWYGEFPRTIIGYLGYKCKDLKENICKWCYQSDLNSRVWRYGSIEWRSYFHSSFNQSIQSIPHRKIICWKGHTPHIVW